MILRSFFTRLLFDHFRSFIINHRWSYLFGYKIDWNNPKDINEKMQWLCNFSDISEWSRCADKYRVREFLKERGMEHLAVKFYGVWKKAEDIDFSSLPEKFVLKCNHDKGSIRIIDKSKPYNREEIIRYLNEALKVKYGYKFGEMHYNKIKPCIIAEEYLENTDSEISNSLIDYKMWCFDGKPYCVLVCLNRIKGHLDINIYDMEWNVHPEHTVYDEHLHDGKGVVPKPKTFEKMKEAASILSKGFPEVRVDFYESNGILYFGEMTFMTYSGTRWRN